MSLRRRFSRVRRLASVKVFLVRYLSPVEVKVKAPVAVTIPYSLLPFKVTDCFYREPIGVFLKLWVTA